MRFVIITGLSGAGKSQAVRSMEDMGYYCIDNMPPALIPKFAELCFGSQGKLSKVALVSDIRGGEMFNQLFEGLDELQRSGYNYEILFLDASNETLIKRYKESRRKHPLSTDDRLPEAISREREMLAEVRKKANHIIDTTDKTQKNLKAELDEIYNEKEQEQSIVINVLSFGFKYGIPLDSDLVFDVRFLPNPYYIEDLKPKNGLDESVSGYVMSFPQSKEFRDKLCDMIDFLVPQYIEEGKAQLVISIGCTGGKHRSVTLAEELLNHLKLKHYRAFATHRDYLK